MWIQPRRIVARYFDSWWIPAAMVLVALVAFTMTAGNWKLAVHSDAVGIVVGLSFLGVVSASLWNFIQRRWVKGIINLLALPVCGAATAFALFAAMFGPSEDGFGKDIVIPPNMKVESPLESKLPTSPATDSEGQALIASFSTNSAGGGQEMSVNMPALNEFSGRQRGMLLRHLASSAKWFVTKERGKVYACRRCVVNGRWQNSLNGFYSASTFDMWADKRFQFRIIIGPNGPAMDEPWRAKATVVNILDRVARLKAIEDKKYEQGVESYLVLQSKGAALEVFEQSPSRGRPFTPLALQQIDKELQSVLSSVTAQQRKFDPSLMPPESTKTGEAEIQIENGMQGGIYFVYAYVNPGEAGYAYLKAFEATRNTPLSAHEIRERSTEFIGWSNDPKEHFFYNSEVMVYEGDWGVYYPARLELWFVPDSGRPDRKLVEKIFKIEGWQR